MVCDCNTILTILLQKFNLNSTNIPPLNWFNINQWNKCGFHLIYQRLSWQYKSILHFYTTTDCDVNLTNSPKPFIICQISSALDLFLLLKFHDISSCQIRDMTIQQYKINSTSSSISTIQYTHTHTTTIHSFIHSAFSFVVNRTYILLLKLSVSHSLIIVKPIELKLQQIRGKQTCIDFN